MLGTVATGIVWWVVATIMQEPDPLWAEIAEYHAFWDVDAGHISESIKFVKHEDCADIKLSKAMRRSQDGQVVGDPIVINGNLREQMLRVTRSAKASHLFAQGKPRMRVSPAPGEYLITLVAICEKDVGAPTGPIALRTASIDATIVISPAPHLPQVEHAPGAE